MDVQKYFTMALAKKIGVVLYEEAIFPAMKDIVADTENTWDDAALLAADGLIREWLKDMTK